MSGLHFPAWQSPVGMPGRRVRCKYVNSIATSEPSNRDLDSTSRFSRFVSPFAEHKKIHRKNKRATWQRDASLQLQQAAAPQPPGTTRQPHRPPRGRALRHHHLPAAPDVAHSPSHTSASSAPGPSSGGAHGPLAAARPAAGRRRRPARPFPLAGARPR